MIYLNRDNEVRFRLKQNGRDVTENSVTKVTLWLPSSASSLTDEPLVFDSEVDDELSLEDDRRVVVIRLGHADVNDGSFLGFITVYDLEHPNGIAWAKETIRIKTWP